MKKISRYIFISILAILFGFAYQNSKVDAITTAGAWGKIQNYQVDSAAGIFNDKTNSKTYNYKFLYDLKITTSDIIPDDNGNLINSEIYVKYQGTEEVDVNDPNHVIIKNSNEKMTVEYYNINLFNGGAIKTDAFTYCTYNNGAFESCTSKESNSSGEINLGEGLYRLSADVEGTVSNTYLLVINREIFNYQFTKYEMTKKNQTNEYKIEIEFIDPRQFSENYIYCNQFKLGTNMLTSSSYNCKAKTIDDGSLNKKITFTITPNGDEGYLNGKALTLYTNIGNFKLELPENAQESLIIDFKKPVLNGQISFYNKDFKVKEFIKDRSTNSSGFKVSKNSNVSFEIEEDSNFVATLNSKECLVEVITENDIDKKIITCSLLEQSGTRLNYSIEDEYGNIYEFTQDNIVWDNEFTTATVDLNDYVDVNENIIQTLGSNKGVIKVSVKLRNDVTKWSVYFSEDFSGVSLSENSALIGINVPYYYVGKINVLISDEALNIVSVIKDVEFKQTFDEEFHPATPAEFDSSVEFSFNSFAKDVENFLAKYGVPASNIHDKYLLVDGVKVPAKDKYTYLEIINDFLQDSTCAFEVCDKELKLVTEYKLGENPQSIEIVYKYKDLIPTIDEKTAKLLHQKDLTLEFKKFDINSKDNLISLNLEGLTEQDLIAKGRDDKVYLFSLTPEVIGYIDTEGNETRFETSKNYDFIGTDGKIGTYLIEYKLKITKEKDSQNQFVNVSDDRYMKSFFINVVVADTTKPQLTLKGEAEMQLKQHDTPYSEPGYTCEDLDECKVTIEYYYNDEKVESVDTTKVGKYIIKYIATDTSGNSIEEQRIVEILSQNSIDITTVVIVAGIILVFVLFVVLSVMNQRKKKNRLNSDGE